MNNIVKTALILIGAGAIMILGAMVMAGFDFSRFNSMDFRPVSYELNDSFQNIVVDATECDVRLVYAPGPCRVETLDSQWIQTQVEILTQAGTGQSTLQITRKNTTPWWRSFGIWWNNWPSDLAITVYLPENWYDTVDIHTVSGDVDIPAEFAFNRVAAKVTSGNISMLGWASDSMGLETVSGHIVAAGAAGSVSAKTTSGRIELRDVTADVLTVQTVSGSVTLEQVTVSERARVDTTSGRIRLEDFDAGTMDIKTVSGSVTGTLLSPKNFQCKTVSGEVSVALQDPDAGLCKVETTSGNIHLEPAN